MESSFFQGRQPPASFTAFGLPFPAWPVCGQFKFLCQDDRSVFRRIQLDLLYGAVVWIVVPVAGLLLRRELQHYIHLWNSSFRRFSLIVSSQNLDSVLLKERKKARDIRRLALGVHDVIAGDHVNGHNSSLQLSNKDAAMVVFPISLCRGCDPSLANRDDACV